MGYQRNSDTRRSLFRTILLVVIFAVAIVIFVARLLSLQIADSEYYKALATPKNEKTVIIESTRGEIADRNGERLVINKAESVIRLNRSLLPYGRENEVLLTLIRFFDENHIPLEDKLPVSSGTPYIFKAPDDSDSLAKKQLSTFLRASKLDISELSGTGFYEKIYERYGISKNIGEYATEGEIRRVLGMRYTLEASDFGIFSPYILVENASIELRTKISEIGYTMPGVEIAVRNSRFYPYGSTAAHLLGRTGPIYPEETEEYLSRGYSLSDTVGKVGAEYAFEKYLKGSNGRKIIEYDAKGEQILGERIPEGHEPEYGKTVYLTISLGMQQAAEKALGETINEINIRNIRNGNPERCTGAVVVENCTNGEILTIASYPSYDQNQYREIISDMLTDKMSPLLNRATNGTYPPGSTFKIATAVAALEDGVVDANTSFYDSGIYKEYEDYQPHCWYFDRYGIGHGYQNLVSAISNSCNYYFFEVGKRLGTDKLNIYAKRLGLGEKTGIEIGEDEGILAGPEYSASVGKSWNPGDLIQSAIGQSDNAFTPIQLASFFSTVVNGGTRYKTHILKSVNNFYSGETIYHSNPVVLSDSKIPEDHLELVKRGMKSVVEDGTAASVFVGYKNSVGGKTGTAQTGSGSDNAVFAGFAPYEDPNIVVSVVIEHGEHSYTASRVAKSVFDYYFDNIDEFSN